MCSLGLEVKEKISFEVNFLELSLAVTESYIQGAVIA
jgi:hypothetical protein